MSLHCIRPIDLSSYQQHPLHRSEKIWPETNCYIDVWIEILHALRLDPVACLSMVFAVDFDGDQWTFYKPPHEDLFELYGLDIQELNIWRNLIDNVNEQLRRGRMILIETDAYYLPDTAGTDYRTKHTKTTIGIQEIDMGRKTLGYFHNASYFQLQDEDFIKTFRLDVPHDPNHMPFLAEFVRFDRLKRLSSQDLAAQSKTLLIKHFARRPRTNPIIEFAESFTRDIEWLKTAGLATYHAYAFATLRQLGSAFEIASFYIKWLESHGQLKASDVAQHCELIAQTSKSMLLKTARAVNTKKPVDFAPNLDEMSKSWDILTSTLAQLLKQ